MNKVTETAHLNFVSVYLAAYKSLPSVDFDDTKPRQNIYFLE